MIDYPGWKHVEFKGDGVFEVDYEISGTLDRELIFPSPVSSLSGSETASQTRKLSRPTIQASNSCGSAALD